MRSLKDSSIELGKFSAIEDSAAEFLASRCGYHGLRLDGLAAISETAAAFLAQCRGASLDLGGLLELPA